jgi:MoaA/NifB/PqqE/SkfB family radical SAM enzyme
MTLHEAKASLRRFADVGLHSVKLTGGEPLMRSDMEAILLACRSYNIEPTLCTNGVLLTRHHVELLRQLDAKVKVSLHGVGGRHDAVVGAQVEGAILRNICSLVDAGVRTSLHVLVIRHNMHTLDEIVRFASSVGISKVSFIAFVPRGRGAFTPSTFAVKPDESRQRVLKVRAAWPSIDVRWLDFAMKPYYVLETDGSLWIQRGTDAEDEMLLASVFQ